MPDPLAPIPYGRQSVNADDMAAVEAVLRGDWLTQGPAVKEFEEAFAAECDAPHAVAFSSGTAALHGAAFAAGIIPGDELITSAMTFAASANCGAYVGAKPVFADIDPDTFNVSADTVAAVSSRKTGAVIPVHYAGLAAPTADIRQAFGPDVAIIEDASHAVGAFDAQGRPVGSCHDSDMATFSFHPVKSIAAGEGGMVTTRNPALADALRTFRTHGITNDPNKLRRKHQGGWYHEQQELGFNYRLSDIHAALALSQLKRLGEFISRRNEIADRYRAELADVHGVLLPPAATGHERHAYHLFVIRLRDADARRDMYQRLRERKILSQVHYVPVYWHPWYEDTYAYREGLCPAAEQHYARCLSIPCFPDLSESDQTRVIEAIRDLA